MGRSLAGEYDFSRSRWLIRRPLRLFVDVESLFAQCHGLGTLRVEKSSAVVSLGDGSRTILLNRVTLERHVLGEFDRFAWQALTESDGLEAAMVRLQAQLGADRCTIRRDVISLVGKLAKAGYVTVRR